MSLKKEEEKAFNYCLANDNFSNDNIKAFIAGWKAYKSQTLKNKIDDIISNIDFEITGISHNHREELLKDAKDALLTVQKLK